jgi:hypothetical protein
MAEYRHHVSGFFARREEAEGAQARLLAHGLPGERLHLVSGDTALPAPAPPEGSKAVLKNILVDGAIGTAVGTGLGALGEVALVAANVSLFVASPLIAPLAMLGWGASLGGLLGAAAGSVSRDGEFSDLVRDAVSTGQTVLVLDSRTAQETAIARDVMQASVRDVEVVAAVPV